MTPQVHTELWTSWASVLRSYAAAHGLNSLHHAVVEVSADEITLRVNDRWLRIRTNAEGFGGLDFHTRVGFPFVIREDGFVLLFGEWTEMDMAAERLAREMMQEEWSLTYAYPEIT